MSAEEFRVWYMMFANNPRFGNYHDNQEWEIDLMTAYLAYCEQETARLREQIADIRDRIIIDQATGAGDYSEAEAYADRMIGSAAAPTEGSTK
jgi:hypothetical protein